MDNAWLMFIYVNFFNKALALCSGEGVIAVNVGSQ